MGAQGVKMKQWIALSLMCLFLNSPAWALQERHLIIVRHAQAQPSEVTAQSGHLTSKGQAQAKEMAQLLLRYGFDNRSIEAVLVPPLQAAHETATLVAEIGVFGAEKIKTHELLLDIDGEAAETKKKRIMGLFENVAKSYTKGHVIVIAQESTAQGLIEVLTHEKVKLDIASAYVLPIEPKSITA